MIFIGIYSNQFKHIISCVHKEKNKFYINHLDTFTTDVKPLYKISPFLEKKSFTLVTGLPVREIFIRNFSYKITSRRKIRSTLSFQMEPYLPFSPQEVILLPSFYANKKFTEVFFIAGSKISLTNHLDYWKGQEVDPDIVSSIAVACFRFAQYFFPTRLSLLIYFLEEEQSTFVAISEGKISLAQTFSLGKKDFALESRFSQEVKRIQAFLSAKCPSIHELLFLGEIEDIKEKLSDLFSPTFFILELQNPSLAVYAPAIGLAFDGAIQNKQSNQFRTQGNLSKKFFQKRKTWLRRYFYGWGLTLGILVIFGCMHIRKKEKQLLTLLNVSKENSLQKAIVQLETSLSTKKKPLVTIPNIPSVSEVILWLNHHPKLQDLSIINFQYTLTKMPKLGSSISSFSAKIDLELTTTQPRLARNFYEALLSEKDMIDQTQEIPWFAQKESYKTSFFLKSVKPINFLDKMHD